MKQTTFRIRGMSCAACSARIEKVLNRKEGVAEAAVNLTAAKLYLTYDADKITEEDVIRIIANLGFEALPPEEKVEHIYSFRGFLISACCLLPLMYITMGDHLFSLPQPGFLQMDAHPLVNAFVQLALCLPVVWMGRRFYVNGIPLLVKGHPNMDSLIALGTSAAFLYSIYSLIRIAGGDMTYTHQLYFETAAMIITLVLLGKYLEERAKGKADSSVRDLLALAPKEALLLRNGEEVTVPVWQVCPGDIVVVRPGAALPVDGTVVVGGSSLNEAWLTGESLPRDVQPGDSVTGGAINGAGVFQYKAERVGKDTVLSQVARLMEEAQSKKAPISRLADKAAGIFVPCVLGIAALAALCWIIAGAKAAFVVRIFIAVLVVACPCALGLATPTAITVGMGRAARMGVLIKGGAVLEETAHIRWVALDKTGTITRGAPSVHRIHCVRGREEEALSLAYALERFSEHPLAAAINQAAEEHGLEAWKAEELEILPGAGICGKVQGKSLLIGDRRLMTAHSVDVTAAEDISTAELETGSTMVYLAADGELLALFFLADQLRPESISAISALHELGLSTVMISGDNQRTANAIGRRVGIDQVKAEVLPAGKLDLVKELQAMGPVMMVGDGINDAPALTQANIGAAVGSGADIAVESADVVFLRDDLRLAAGAVELSRRTLRVIRQNLVWAFCYNLALIPLAAGLVYALGGPLMAPALGAAAMSLSSVTVVSNALRLRAFRPSYEKRHK